MDGTTDITRTVSFGQPSDKEKVLVTTSYVLLMCIFLCSNVQECFTLVLKGHIALCSAVFPENTMGNQLDFLARSALWDFGLDYKHGTGHGVGSFLNVYEGSHKSKPCPKPLCNGMFVTDGKSIDAIFLTTYVV